MKPGPKETSPGNSPQPVKRLSVGPGHRWGVRSNDGKVLWFAAHHATTWAVLDAIGLQRLTLQLLHQSAGATGYWLDEGLAQVRLGEPGCAYHDLAMPPGSCKSEELVSVTLDKGVSIGVCR